MTDLIVLASQISFPVKVAWVLWLVWATLQIGWYRRARIVAPSPEPARPARVERRPEPPRHRPDSLSPPKPFQVPARVVATVSQAPQPPNGAGVAAPSRGAHSDVPRA